MVYHALYSDWHHLYSRRLYRIYPFEIAHSIHVCRYDEIHWVRICVVFWYNKSAADYLSMPAAYSPIRCVHPCPFKIALHQWCRKLAGYTDKWGEMYRKTWSFACVLWKRCRQNHSGSWSLATRMGAWQKGRTCAISQECILRGDHCAYTSTRSVHTAGAMQWKIFLSDDWGRKEGDQAHT